MIFQRIHIKNFELGLMFKDGDFVGIIEPGRHQFFDFNNRLSIEVHSQRAPFFQHEQLDVIVKSGALKGRAIVLDLKDDQRALVWVDNRFSHVLAPGLHAYWTGQKDVCTEIVDATDVRLNRSDWKTIVNSPMSAHVLQTEIVPRNHVGLLFFDGQFQETLSTGSYVFWKNITSVAVERVDLREQSIDVSGQDIMTSDKVTLRLNASLNYRVTDARKTISEANQPEQSLYREAQLILRAVIGSIDLDRFLTDKDAIADSIFSGIQPRVERLGYQLLSVGIRDVLLPGDMKDLMNKVTEARKAAEANLISRREETAAMRSQANTAKLLADNPVLMRLKELEVVERVAAAGQLKIVLSDTGDDNKRLTDKITSLI
ncbi:MAG: slipin family protein [Fuerstiella sp.]